MSSSWTVKSEAMTKRLCFGSTFCASFLMNSSNSTRPAQHWFDEQTQTTPPVFPTFLIQMTTKGPGQTKDIDVLHLRMCCSLTWSEIAIFVVFVLDHTIAQQKTSGPGQINWGCPFVKNGVKKPRELHLANSGAWKQTWKQVENSEAERETTESMPIKDRWMKPLKGAPIWSPCHSAFSSRFHVMPQFHKTKQIGCVPVDPQRCTFKDVPCHAPRLHTKSHLDSNSWIKFPNLSLVEQNTTEWQIAKIDTQDRHQKQKESNSKWQNDPAKLTPRPSGRYIEGNQAKQQSKWTKAMSKLA